MSQLNRKEQRALRHRRLRRKIQGTAVRPRLALFVSNRHLCVQFIDDDAARTLASVSTVGAQGRLNCAAAVELGRRAAETARGQGLSSVVVDRGGHKYHGRVKALVEALAAGGVAVAAKEGT
jgi:large subunit ribosomal protein L18